MNNMEVGLDLSQCSYGLTEAASLDSTLSSSLIIILLEYLVYNGEQ